MESNSLLKKTLNTGMAAAKAAIPLFMPAAQPIMKAEKALATDHYEKPQPTVEPKKSLVSKTVSKAKELFTAPTTYKAEPISQPIEVQKAKEAPKMKPPKVVETMRDLYGQYKVLESGATVRNIPDKFKVAVKEAYKAFPNVPKGTLETVLMQESSMGTNRNQYNKDLGEYAWLVGFTNVAKKDLIDKGVEPNLSTPEGAIAAAAAYLAMKQEVKDNEGNTVETYDNPTKLYVERYAPQLKPDKHSTVDEIARYYATST